MHIVTEYNDNFENPLSGSDVFICTCGWVGLKAELLCGPSGLNLCPYDTVDKVAEDSKYWEELGAYEELNDTDVES